MSSASIGTTSQPVDTGKFTARYYSLVNDVGGYVCRQTFLQECMKKRESLSTFLDDNEEVIKELSCGKGKMKVFSIEQINKLFPDGKAASSPEEFDISLSLSLLRNLIFPSQTNSIWNKGLHDIKVEWTTPIAHFARVRIYRNKMVHDIPDTSTSMPENVFWSNWEELTRIFLHLGKLYNIPDVYRKIDDLLHKPLDEARESELDNEIKLLREEVARSEQIDGLTGFAQTIDLNVIEMKDKVDDIYKGMPTIEEIEIKDDVPESIFKKDRTVRESKREINGKQNSCSTWCTWRRKDNGGEEACCRGI